MTHLESVLLCCGGGLIIMLICATAIARFGADKGYPFLVGFGLSFATNPIAAWIILWVLPERPKRHPVSPELLLAIELEKERMARANVE